jgi:invasion protein IalB
MSDVQRKLFVALLAGTFLSGVAFAQDTTTPATPATEPPAETPAEGQTEGQTGTTEIAPRSMGEEVVDPNAPGTIYEKEVSGDWSIRCIRTESGNDPCQIFQGLKDGTGRTVAEVTMVALANSGEAVAGATVTTPLGTLLTEPLIITIDGGAGKRYPYTWCDQDGCHARIGFNADGLAGLKKGAAAMVVVFPLLTPDQPVELKMGLSGFTAAFDNMAKLNEAAATAEAAAAPAEGATPPAEGTTPPAEGAASGN